MKRIIRVFPRKTAATPDDALVRIAEPPTLFDEADEVHVSVAFTWDLPFAEKLAGAWRHVAPVTIGGPALGEYGGEFVPGMYVKKGYMIHARGCPNSCWFCAVHKNEGRTIRPLAVYPGYNDLTSNLLACPEDHVKAVFAAMKAGKKLYRQPAEFTGGLEAAKLDWWHIDLLQDLKPKQMFFAYDTPDDLPHLWRAGSMLLHSGWTRKGRALRCYVLCGYPKDTFAKAERRMQETMASGFMPMAMVYRGQDGEKPPEWAKWQRKYARPAMMAKEYCCATPQHGLSGPSFYDHR